MLIRDFIQAGKVVDYTRELLTVPNQYGVIQNLGLFQEESVAANTVMFEESTQNGGLVIDRVRGERNTQNSDRTRQARALAIPHFPLDDYITPADIQGLRAYGTPDMAERLAEVRARKLADVALKHNMTLEVARSKLLTTGDFYAPSGTVAGNIFTEFGVTQKSVNYALDTLATDVVAKVEAGIAHILDNTGGENVSGFVALCSPQFFASLINHANVKEAYKYYTANQPVMGRERLGGSTSFRREFFFAGVTFIEVRDIVAGVKIVPDNEAVLLPQGTTAFTTFFAPANTFSAANTLGERQYVWEKAEDDVKIILQTESNFLNLMKRPQMVVKLVRN